MRPWLAAIALCMGLAASPAGAGDPAGRARALYDEATDLAGRGEHAAAASLFAQADLLEPNPVALKSALRAAMLADAVALGMELVERAEGRDLPPDGLAAVEEARAAFSDRAGRVRIRCPSVCTARLDGRSIAVDRHVWTEVGDHEVEIVMGGKSSVERVAVARRALVEVKPPARAARPDPRPRHANPEPEPTADEGDGVSPAFFWVGLGLSAALGAGTIASAVDTANRWDQFQETGEGAEDGRDAELRTNALFSVTLGVVVATAVVGVFVVDWGGGTLVGALRPGGMSLTGRF